MAEAPPPRAIYTSNPRRHLRRLVEVWLERILPRVPGALLDVYDVTNLKPGDDAWTGWGGTLLPAGVPQALRGTVRINPSASREDLVGTVRQSHAMLYLGHKVEAFCLALAEAQALGVPCVVAPTAVLPDRVIDGVSGFVRGDEQGFADAAVALRSDPGLWRAQHEAALRLRQGVSWDEVAARFELALLSDILPTD